VLGCSTVGGQPHRRGTSRSLTQERLRNLTNSQVLAAPRCAVLASRLVIARQHRHQSASSRQQRTQHDNMIDPRTVINMATHRFSGTRVPYLAWALGTQRS